MNTFENNGSAIFVTDNPGDVALRDNTFRNSSDYHVKLGIQITENIKIEGGVFEIPADRTVGEMVFDHDDDSDLGRVIFLP